jgi:tRNA (cmo5U34)-methyltransferase
MKSSVDEIRQRFDADVERFSTLETGQTATMDAPLVLELIAQAAAATTPGARALLDVGCGAGNYSLKLLERLPDMEVTLMDLSRPMLDRASQRVSVATGGRVVTAQADVREVELEAGQFDVIVAAAVLHHLRSDQEWEAVFSRFHRWLRPGGAVWISDYIEQDTPGVQRVMQKRFGEYLTQLKDEAYREKVFAYIEAEDSPRSLVFQLDMLRTAGFSQVDVLHKNGPFAAFGGIR